MTRYSNYRSMVLLICVMLFSAVLSAQTSAEVLATTRKIADKIIRETSFEFQMVPLAFNGGIIQFSVDDLALYEGNGVFYAYGKMNSEKEAPGLLGISFVGQIKVFLNGSDLGLKILESILYRVRDM